MSSAVPSRPKTVLVVDDTSANRRLYASILETAGFVVHTASDGEEALLAVQTSEPSLVLLDYMMPRLDGLGVLCALRGDPSTRDLPVVMLTASAEPDHIDRALDAGANDYITKPVNGKILVARIRSMISAYSGTPRDGAEHDALLADLDDAARVQEAQLPVVPVKASGWTVTGAVVPSGKIGGDLFDIVVESDGRVISFLLDVSGHGTASALVAAEIRAEFRNLIRGRSLSEAFARLNAHMSRRATGKFCCLAAVETAENKITIVNAGLPPVIIVRRNEVVESVWGSGIALGLFGESSYEETVVRVLPGDRVVLLSDGLTEPFGAADDSRAAIDRLALWPREGDSWEDPRELRSRVSAASSGSSPAMDDDKTVLVLSLDSPWIQKTEVPPTRESVAAAVRFAQTRCPEWVDRERLDHGLTEAVTNAIVHGTLGISSELRAEDTYQDFFKQKPGSLDDVDPIEIAIEQTLDTFAVHVRWANYPCPPSRQRATAPPPSGTPLLEYEAHGMGMRLIHSLFDRVTWDDDGLGLSLYLARLESAA